MVDREIGEGLSNGGVVKWKGFVTLKYSKTFNCQEINQLKSVHMLAEGYAKHKNSNTLPSQVSLNRNQLVHYSDGGSCEDNTSAGKGGGRHALYPPTKKIFIFVL